MHSIRIPRFPVIWRWIASWHQSYFSRFSSRYFPPPKGRCVQLVSNIFILTRHLLPWVAGEFVLFFWQKICACCFVSKFKNIPESQCSVMIWQRSEATSFRWRHNDHDGVSNHQPHGCLLNRLFRRRSNKTSKLRVTGLCAGKSPGPVNSPHKGTVTRKMFPFDDVIMLTSWLVGYGNRYI